MNSGFAYCNVSIMPVRLEPSHRSEQVNQLLFGEKVEVIEINKNDWVKIKGLFDGYMGWCKHSQLKNITRKEYLKATKCIVVSNNSKIIFGSAEADMPIGSELTGFTGNKIELQEEPGKFKGKKVLFSELQQDFTSLSNAAMQYIYAPYQWGGRSIAGIDCSGLTQMAFKLCNIKLKRDASQQAQQGVLVDFLQNSKPGDLAFFDDKEGKIIHVGILLDHQTIIHASDTTGRVMIDRIDQGGIISLKLKKRTHNLRVVKRILKNIQTV